MAESYHCGHAQVIPSAILSLDSDRWLDGICHLAIWLVEHDVELALPSVAIAEVAFGIEKIRPEERAARLAQALDEWRSRFSDRIFSFTEDAALAYGELMGRTIRAGRTRTVQGGMIAAIARVHGAALATRNIKDFQGFDIDLIDPWND